MLMNTIRMRTYTGVSVSRVVLDEMRPFVEQPQFLLEPNSTFVFENAPIELECKAIRARQIFFNCDHKWVPEHEHIKSTETNVSSFTYKE